MLEDTVEQTLRDINPKPGLQSYGVHHLEQTWVNVHVVSCLHQSATRCSGSQEIWKERIIFTLRRGMFISSNFYRSKLYDPFKWAQPAILEMLFDAHSAFDHMCHSVCQNVKKHGRRHFSQVMRGGGENTVSLCHMSLFHCFANLRSLRKQKAEIRANYKMLCLENVVDCIDIIG